MTDVERIVVVGASLAGTRTVEALRRCGVRTPVLVIGDEPHMPYDRPPLSKAALLTRVSHDDLALSRREGVDDVEWRLGIAATAADLDRRVVTDASGAETEYSQLVVATGVRPRTLPLAEGRHLRGRYRLRTLDDARRLRDALRPGKNVVIAGGGFLACEVAATASRLGCVVTVVMRGRHPLERVLGEELATSLEMRHAAHGVAFMPGSSVIGAHGDTRIESVQIAGYGSLPCDVLVEAIGAVPNTEWLNGNDIDLDDGIGTDRSLRALRTSGDPWEGVLAIGDLARIPHPLFDGGSRTIPHWNTAIESARAAARVLASQSAYDTADALLPRFAPMPSFWSDQFDTRLLAYGLPELADEAILRHGSRQGDCVYEYRRDGILVGVCGIGFRATLLDYRVEIEAAWERLPTPAS